MILLGSYDVVIVGAGHAGCEAALAAARMGAKTLMLTMNVDSIAQMSCNPAIGGLAKGHIVKEIDALGGEMARVTDLTGIQFRMLNKGKGPAVWAPRAQSDKKLYQWTMKNVLESQPNLDVKMGEVKRLVVEGGKISGVVTSIDTMYHAKSVIITTGTFLNGLIHIGELSFGGGRAGDKPSVGLSACLAELGFEVLRLKTGTPCRLNARSIDYSRLQIQPGDENPEPFSFRTTKIEQEQLPCHLTFTNEKTHRIIKENIHRSPLYSGRIQSRGPRYCPSIEDKVVKFADKERHQIFLEPEGRGTQEVYVNGVSTSLPQDIQIAMIRSVEGLENAELMRFGYAVEYDFIQPTQLHSTLETKHVQGLYLAGQINGTSGYEEAGCQGLMAGINAVLKIRGQEPFILKRHEAYIGVLIDDLVTKGTLEPYRMFTSRAEHRLLLRQDNADLRLMDYGHQLGLISDADHRVFDADRTSLQELKVKVAKLRVDGQSLLMRIKAPETSVEDVCELLRPEGVKRSVATKLAVEVKYEGYIDREQKAIGRSHHLENKKIPETLDYTTIQSMSRESREKLLHIRPATIGQASRISGVRPSDIAILTVVVERHSRSSEI
jgi:tRNA uridine 5-carboxymethylaminomethyl modification enzyme